MKDYIPHKDSELLAWSANFLAVLLVNASIWGLTPFEVASLQTATAEFAALFAQSRGSSKNPVVVAKKNAARDRLIAEIRSLAQFQLKNPGITAAERIALGLPVRSNKHSTIPPPSTRPELDIDVVDFRRLKVSFHDMGSSNRARPYGVVGAVVAFVLSDAPPTDLNALTRTVLATRTPHILEFAEEERGSKVYVALRWVNEKGEMGPWSEIENAIVP